MLGANSHLPSALNASKQSSTISGKLSSHKKTLTSTILDKQTYIAHRPLFDNWQLPNHHHQKETNQKRISSDLEKHSLKDYVSA